MHTNQLVEVGQRSEEVEVAGLGGKGDRRVVDGPAGAGQERAHHGVGATFGGECRRQPLGEVVELGDEHGIGELRAGVVDRCDPAGELGVGLLAFGHEDLVAVDETSFELEHADPFDLYCQRQIGACIGEFGDLSLTLLELGALRAVDNAGVREHHDGDERRGEQQQELASNLDPLEHADGL